MTKSKFRPKDWLTQMLDVSSDKFIEEAKMIIKNEREIYSMSLNSIAKEMEERQLNPNSEDAKPLLDRVLKSGKDARKSLGNRIINKVRQWFPETFEKN